MNVDYTIDPRAQVPLNLAIIWWDLAKPIEKPIEKSIEKPIEKRIVANALVGSGEACPWGAIVPLDAVRVETDLPSSNRAPRLHCEHHWKEH